MLDKNDQRSIDAVLALMKMDAADMSADELRRARQAAGLNVNQVARIVGPLPMPLIAIEDPQRLATLKREMPQQMAVLFSRLNEVYGLRR